ATEFRAAGRLAGKQFLAAGSRPQLGERPSHMGAAWGLWRLLHSTVPLHPLFWEPALLSDEQPAYDLHGIPALLLRRLSVPASGSLAGILGRRLVQHRRCLHRL